MYVESIIPYPRQEVNELIVSFSMKLEATPGPQFKHHMQRFLLPRKGSRLADNVLGAEHRMSYGR
jgi:hypothetical protein